MKDLSDDAYLLRFLDQIFLVNANGIGPEKARL
jgi:hypothetical protein